MLSETEGLIIRPVLTRPSDYAGWCLLYKAYAEFYGVNVTDEIADRVWSWLFDENHSIRGFVAEIDKVLLGLAHVRSQPSTLRGENIGFLDDLYVDQSMRGQGLGERLIARVLEEAEINNWPVVRWITADNNYPARTLYDKMAKKTMWNTYEAEGFKSLS